jgi:hypothetical protein
MCYMVRIRYIRHCSRSDEIPKALFHEISWDAVYGQWAAPMQVVLNNPFDINIETHVIR